MAVIALVACSQNSPSTTPTQPQPTATPETATPATDAPPKTVVVPDVVDMTFKAARRSITKLGLVVRRSNVESHLAPGKVNRQDPRAGSTAELGATVQLYVRQKPFDLGGAKESGVAWLPVPEAARPAEDTLLFDKAFTLPGRADLTQILNWYEANALRDIPPWWAFCLDSDRSVTGDSFQLEFDNTIERDYTLFAFVLVRQLEGKWFLAYEVERGQECDGASTQHP